MILIRQFKTIKRSLSFLIAATFIFSSIIPPKLGFAQQLNLPQPGQMLHTTAPFTPAYIKGMTVYPENPFRFDFIVNTGDTGIQGNELKTEATKLIKYFMASLTTPENEMWVNLSPYEKDRIVPEGFGQTVMGKDLLSMDYILKQLSSSLTNPEGALGKDFWNRVYTRAQAEFGTTNIPVSTFNKIWIVPQDVLVYEQGNSVFVVRRHLKVMLEEDYIALQKNKGIQSYGLDSRRPDDHQGMSQISSRIVREILVPEIEREVNEGKNFANLRQMYNSMILAAWYKKNLQNSLLSQAYVNKQKNKGVNVDDKTLAQQIYNQYLKAYKKGVYNYIKEDVDPVTQQVVPRKYFSGGIPGVTMADVHVAYNPGDLKPRDLAQLSDTTRDYTIESDTLLVNNDKFSQAPFVQVTGNEDYAMLSAKASSGNERVRQIDALLKEIDKEIANKGTGNLPENIVMTDFHGEVKLFADYIADAISQRIGKKVTLDGKKIATVSIKEQLEKQGVDVKDIKSKLSMSSLGDYLDRGPDGIKVFLVVKELVELGIVNISVTGNHDLWAMLNLMVYPYPVYENYNFYGHKVSEDLVKQHWNDFQNQEERIAFWTQKSAEYKVSQDELQSQILDGQANEIRDRYKATYKKIKDQLNPEQRELFEDLTGFYFDTDVSTGFKAIGQMSTQWWQDRLKLVRKFKQEARDSNHPDIIMWDELDTYITEITETVNRRIREALKKGEWWWQVFNDINHQNYTSPEWWGKDWVSHAGWGTSVIEELNKMEGSTRWNQENYIFNPILQELARFYREHFTLFAVDEYGNRYMHGFPSVDETGHLEFTYKGVVYKDKDAWSGLEAIQDDVRNMNTPLSELNEALTLVNSWYADKTTRIKPKDVATFVNKIGLETIYSNLGIHTEVNGHDPLNKLQPKGVGFITRQGPYTHVEVDEGISYKKFNGLGAYTVMGAQGIYKRGYPGPDFKEIVDNPDTVLLAKHPELGYVTKTSWPSNPLEGKEFLGLMKNQLVSEKESLEKMLQISNAPRKPIIGYNLKGELEIPQQVERLLEDIVTEYKGNPIDLNDVEIVVGFSAHHLDRARQTIDRLTEGLVQSGLLKKGEKFFTLAAQNMRAQAPGAFTGYAPSAAELRGLGVEMVILGHSELTTTDLGDHRVVYSDEQINEQVHAALNAGLEVILAYGETKAEKDAGRTKEVLSRQLAVRLKDVTPQQMARIVLAYEPVHAIGKGGVPISAEEAGAVAKFSRGWLYKQYGFEVAAKTRIEYGGSMSAKNVGELSAQSDIDGGLIGGASKKAETAAPIYRQFAVTKAYSERANADKAQNATDVGGINLNPSLLDWHFEKDANGGFLPLEKQPVFNVNIEGAVPVILRVIQGAPAINLQKRGLVNVPADDYAKV